MQRIGRVIHITPSKKAVVKAEFLPRIGERVFDDEHNPVGEVFDIFGSVSSPYVEVKTEAKDPCELVEQSLHVLPSRGKRRKAR